MKPGFLFAETERVVDELFSDYSQRMSGLMGEVNSLAMDSNFVIEWGGLEEIRGLMDKAKSLSKTADNTAWLFKMVEIAHCREQGMTYGEVSRETGVTRKKVEIVIKDVFPHLSAYAPNLRSHDRDRKIMRMRMDGKTLNEISKETGVAIATVQIALKRMSPEGLPDSFAVRRQENADKIIEMREQGMFYDDIAKALKISKGSIKKVLAEHRPELLGDLRLKRFDDDALKKRIVDLRFKGLSYESIQYLTGATRDRVKSLVQEELSRMALAEDFADIT